ncbi:cytochrome-c oxidase, cbb3-type subunit III [Gilvimarinus agarilyticus]|uniref:cytochrome-c oxidase, cbb3-type subunit III n=1 Tax=unclassified Gilvimarinus TaxID=2642066 RepID=UPI001C08AAE2|nr:MULTISPECIES: cytochrome-c oxidase, cbb3-type subunit III [unclassified Gilvimarinus]MBU2886898.1 cytochrome-c oxidase, cbb3-type subunit III [Gilvimarinus agarilyticus]MDO6571559.1 cytochrome-c oxidase, cbb3-type subunit III [Gilvimarinus sp. 2_MG-2023]MDO6747918.1 cytochrome-c oxidase, cbb3-type subunit III [Gilvimarinus sp. 1_MG-2023]
MSTFWSLWIIGLTLTNLVLVLWVLLANRKVAVRDDETPENRTTGHVYDGIEEYDNPLPRWWFKMFIATFIFAGVYLMIYPGLGSFKGFYPGGWTQELELKRHQQKADARYAEQFGKYNAMPIETLAQDQDAMKMGLRLFANNCAVCHGADGGGNHGFPNLTDNDWIWGGSPEKIKETIVQGRKAAMPPWAAILGDEGIAQTTEYVLSLSGREHDEQMALVGAEHFKRNCVACHGADATGNPMLGAPNLTDDIWLYSGEPSGIRQTLREGRNGVMPAQQELLKESRIHLLAAYVYSLSLPYEDQD